MRKRGFVFNEPISIRLDELLRENKVTYQDVSLVTGIPQSTFSDIIRYGKKTGYDNIIALAKFFDVSSDYLLGLSNIRKPEAGVSKEDGYIKLDKLVCLLGDNDIIEKLI